MLHIPDKFPLTTITPTSASYPKLLREIHSAPQTLYLRGDISFLDEMPCVAVVGTRRCTSYGKHATVSLVRDLSRAGICIVSGLALGVDSWAHQTALEENAKTAAVLGSGIDDNSIYPRAHVSLARKILQQGGALMSEYKTGAPTYPSNFPARNRIVAGLSRATIVIEAPLESGALITARFALEQNRDVGSVPGPIFSKESEGSNRLIAQGARCVRSADDILEMLGVNPQEKPAQHSFDSPEEETVYRIVQTSAEPLHLDKIIEKSTLPSAQVVSLLTQMQLSNKIKNIGGERYIAN